MHGNQPALMTIGQFCKFSGLSRWQFTRMRDKYRIALVPRGTCKMVDVQQTIALLTRIPKADDLQVPEMWPGMKEPADAQ
jgi:hypothetical protein